MLNKSFSLICGLMILGCMVAARSYPVDNFDKAKDLYEKFIYQVDNIRKLNKSESQRLVQAIHDADEEERQSVARDAADRVRSEVRSKYDELERLKNDTLSVLEDVFRDEALKDKYSQANDLKRRIGEVWQSVDRMWDKVRGSTNPVAAYMLSAGQEAHTAYQNNSGNCTESEWSISNGRADCLNAQACDVIELKPNNSKSIYKGVRLCISCGANRNLTACENVPSIPAR